MLDCKNQYSENEYTTQAFYFFCYNVEQGCFLHFSFWFFIVSIFNAIPIKLPMVFFRELEQIISQFMETWKTSNSQSSLEKDETGGINLPNYRLYYKATVITIVWYWHRQNYRSTEQNRMSRNKSMYLWTLYLWQMRQKIYNAEKTVSSTSGAGQTVNYM